MSNRKHKFTMGKLMGFYGAAIIALFLFNAGLDAGRQHWFQVALDILIASFGLGFLVIMWLEREDAIRDEMLEWFAEDAKKKLDKIFEQANKSANSDIGTLLDKAEIKHDVDLAHAIAIDVMGGEHREATPEEVARIEQAFNDQTDGEKYLKVHGTNAEGMDMEISAEPIEAVPGRSPAHDAARVRGDEARRTQIPVVDGDEPAKPLTKSQQRRINDKKGFGPITDDEVREQKNAKRRAARLAKKAEAESSTTTTTTQSGQTKLV